MKNHSLATARSFVGYRPHPQKRTKNHSLATARSFVGYRPHTHKRRRSHSLATARSFVGYRPHPHKRMKNHSLATARSFVGYRPHPPLAPPVCCGALERTPPRLVAVRAACRPRRSPCSLALGRLSARTAGASASGFATCRWCPLQLSPCTTSGTRNPLLPKGRRGER